MVIACGTKRGEEEKVCIDMDAEQLAKTVMKMMNSDDRGFTEAMKTELVHEHNTLQQNYVRSIANILVDYCDSNRYVDARNENSKVFACKVKDLLYKERISFPLI